MRTEIHLSEPFLGDQVERGASAVEYALLIAGIATLIIAIVFVLGRVTQGTYASACASWASAAHDASC